MIQSLIIIVILSTSIKALSTTQQRCKQNDNDDPWKYDLTSLGLAKTPFIASESKWEYHIALCGEQNIPITPDIAGDAIVQTSSESDEADPEVHVVGTEIIARHGGEMWVNLVFGGGTPYRSHCNQTQRKAQILFVCDPNAGIGKPTLLDEANENDYFCFYMFEWGTNLVCPENATGPKIRRQTNFMKLVFFELLAVAVIYMVLGVGYRRFVIGARGIEQIPNLKFWTNCKDGVIAVVDKCRGRSNANFERVNTDDSTGLPVSGRLDITDITDDDDERLIIQ